MLFYCPESTQKIPLPLIEDNSSLKLEKSIRLLAEFLSSPLL
jgi:hypothetical protein